MKRVSGITCGAISVVARNSLLNLAGLASIVRSNITLPLTSISFSGHKKTPVDNAYRGLVLSPEGSSL